MSRCEKHIGERPLAVVPVFDVLSGPGELAVIWITGVTAIGNKKTISHRTKAKLAGTLLFGRIKGSGHCSGMAVSRRCTVNALEGLSIILVYPGGNTQNKKKSQSTFFV